MKVKQLEHSPEVHPVDTPGRPRLYQARCAAGDWTCPKRRRTPDAALEDGRAHVLERVHLDGSSSPVTWEATIVLRVAARTPREAIREFRRQLIHMAMTRALPQSLRELRPITTELGRRAS